MSDEYVNSEITEISCPDELSDDFTLRTSPVSGSMVIVSAPASVPSVEIFTVAIYLSPS